MPPAEPSSAPSPLEATAPHRRAPWLDALLRLHDTPTRTAAAFALGVFFSFSPFLGLQILVSMALAFLFGLNRLAVFVGLNANLPWILVPWYVGTTLLAATVLGTETPGDVGQTIQQLFAADWAPNEILPRLQATMRPVLVPFLIGPTIGAALLGSASFVVARGILIRRAAVTSRRP